MAGNPNHDKRGRFSSSGRNETGAVPTASIDHTGKVTHGSISVKELGLSGTNAGKGNRAVAKRISNQHKEPVASGGFYAAKGLMPKKTALQRKFYNTTNNPGKK